MPVLEYQRPAPTSPPVKRRLRAAAGAVVVGAVLYALTWPMARSYSPVPVLATVGPALLVTVSVAEWLQPPWWVNNIVVITVAVLSYAAYGWLLASTRRWYIRFFLLVGIIAVHVVSGVYFNARYLYRH